MRSIFIFYTLLFIVLSCKENPEKEASPSKLDNIKIVAPNCDHIITESQSDYPTTLRSDSNMLIFDRMILEVVLNAAGEFTIEGETGDWAFLKDQIETFYEANRNLGNIATTSLKKDKGYRFGNKPFYSYFTKATYESFIKQVATMAETDPTAKLYLKRHRRRIQAFDAVPDKELGFINLGAVIRYVCAESLSEKQVDEFEHFVAEVICDMRNDLSREKFGKTYAFVRREAQMKNEARKQLLYLQEMYPAYLMKARDSFYKEWNKTSPRPVLTPPPIPDIMEEEATEKEPMPILD